MNIEANLKHKHEIYAVVLESASRDAKKIVCISRPPVRDSVVRN